MRIRANVDPTGFAFLVVGLVLFGGAWWAYGRRRAIADTPTSKVRSMAIGPVELIGSAAAAPSRELLRAPFTEEPCVYWEWKVEQWKKRGKSHKWVTVATDRSELPFGLRDETGVARIDAEGADLPAPLRTRYGSGWGKDPPASVLDDLARRGISHENWLGMNRQMRFTEGRLAEGTTLYVLGNATRPDEATGEGNEALVVRRKGDGVFLVSTSSEKALMRNWTLGFWAFLLIGISAAAFGTARLAGVDA